MAKKQYKVRVYRLHDLDIVSWICTREFNLVRAVYSVLKAFCKGETFLIETPPKREVDIPVSTLGRVYQRSLYLDPEEDEEVIELLDSIASGYRNCFMKNLLRQYIVIPVDESFLAAGVDVGNYLHQFDVLKEGKKVILGAGDTFRAAAIEQLEEWANRAGAEIVKSTQGSDPGAVVFDTLVAAQSRGADIAIIDTAGRLHNKNNLMKELEKIHNIIKKKLGEQKYESILVIDGTTGQNALNQAKVFNEVTELTGFIITKLDGTAKGGIVFSISEEIKKPIKFIGVGEKIEDLREFNANEYIQAIFD